MRYQDVAEESFKYGVPIRVIPNFNNAFYVRPRRISQDVERNIKNMPDTPKREALSATVDFSKLPSGGIVLGEKLMNPTVIAHEVGHKMDSDKLHIAAPELEKTWSAYGVPIGTAAAVLLGAIFPKYKIPLALGNLGVQALSAVPTLLSESKASEIARKIYPEVDQKMLDSMYNTYVVSQLKKKLLLPGAVHAGDLAISKILRELL